MTDIAQSSGSGVNEANPLDGYRVVHRAILRPDQDKDIRPLYIGGATGATTTAGSRQSGAAVDDADVSVQPESSSESVADSGKYGAVRGTSAVARPGRGLTFSTYFNAFPAGYWRRWTDFRTVRLVAVVEGEGTLTVTRSTSKAHTMKAASFRIDSHGPQTIVADLPLKPFIDGGWYWFEIQGGDNESLTLHSAQWAFESDAPQGTFSVGITTFNRPDFCVDQLVALADNPEVLDILDEIFVVDQGNQNVRDDERYDEVAARLGSKLRLIEQGNLGGSGGFSRAMVEAVESDRSDYLLLLDDDVVCELEGLLRAVAFADLCETTTLVGGQMFSLYDRSVLHAYGEAVDRWKWFWGAAPNTEHGHNFAKRSLPTTPWLHRRIDVDYNGWWECLIPLKVIKEIGASLPMFIKWDDSEFGLRAAENGYPTVTLPGVAVWHVPWHEKDDTIDWQAYFHRRNRLIACLLHSPYDNGGRMVRASFETDMRHLLSMQYGPAKMCLMAVQDVLDGPQRMHRDVLERMGELRKLRAGYDDSVAKPNLEDFPTPRRHKPPKKGKDIQRPVGRVGQAKTALAAAVRQMSPVRPTAMQHPEASVPHLDLRWWRLAQYDSALVSSADGSTASWYKRDPQQFKELLAESIRLNRRLQQEWPELSKQYKDALPELVAPETWRRTFDASVEKAERDEAEKKAKAAAAESGATQAG